MESKEGEIYQQQLLVGGHQTVASLSLLWVGRPAQWSAVAPISSVLLNAMRLDNPSRHAGVEAELKPKKGRKEEATR